MRQRIVIVGGSLAGGTAAVTLRDAGFDGDIQLIGAERRLPYNRPALSKAYLRGEERFEQQLVNPAGAYAQRGIELRLGVRAISIDATRKEVELDSDERLGYDRLLVTTGGRNRAPSMEGADLPGVFQLRTVEESDAIRQAGQRGRRAVVVGLGFIGSEVTASLRQRGVDVIALAPERAPLARVLGPEVGEALAAMHRDHGVEVVIGDSAEAFEGSGHVERVRTRKGRRIECDFVVVGIGIVPNAELLGEAGASLDNGVLVDERCRTSLPDVYAAGDVTNHQHPLFGRLRVEHWNNGYRQGQAAAQSMLGDARPYDYLHSFWSDQYEHKLEYVGFAAGWDRVVFRGRLAERRFLGFYLNDGRVRAAVGLDRGGDPEDANDDAELKAVAALIRERVRVDPAQLADEDVDLRRLARLAA